MGQPHFLEEGKTTRTADVSMTSIDCIERIADTHLIECDLKYCLVKPDKRPYKIDGSPARPNAIEDFVSFEDLLTCQRLNRYAGIGISIQASNIFAIDVDHCFSVKNDVSSGDERARYFLNTFNNTYCEFSFSGTGLRVLFRANVLPDYSEKYYIKNEKNGVEFYQPSRSYRYVTVTGNAIHNNQVIFIDRDILESFLDAQMKRTIGKAYKVNTSREENKTLEELQGLVKYHYFTNPHFQDLWFENAPGSGKDESERDFFILSYLFENVTQDKEMLKELFESSPFFKSKDEKHVRKWNNQDFRYYNYLYDTINKKH